MKIETAREYFALGLVTGATVRPPSIMHPDGWTVELIGRTGSVSPMIETARGDVRQWKTLDAVGRTIAEIGLKRWEVLTE